MRIVNLIEDTKGDGGCLDWNRPIIDFYLSLGARPMSEWTAYRLGGET